MPKLSNERRLERPAFRKRELELEKECNRVGAYYEKVKSNEQPNETTLRRNRITKRIHSKERKEYECITDVVNFSIAEIGVEQQQPPRPPQAPIEFITGVDNSNIELQQPPPQNNNTQQHQQHHLPTGQQRQLNHGQQQQNQLITQQQPQQPPLHQQHHYCTHSKKRKNPSTQEVLLTINSSQHQPPNRVHRRTNNPTVRPPSSRTRSKTKPRRSPRHVQEQVSVRPPCQQSGRTAQIKTKTLDGIINKAGLKDSINKILSELFEHPFRPPWSGGRKGFIIGINSTSGNNRYLNIERPGYLRQSYSTSSCDQRLRPRSATTRLGYVYGTGSGAVSFGDVPTQLCCREMCQDMLRIRDTVQRELKAAFGSDTSVNTDAMFNTCELIFYYEEKEIRFHRDMTFINGKYSEASNSQIENTAVGILVAGDSRDLEFALHDPAGKQIDDDPRIINLSHGKLLLLHPNDEKDCTRYVSGERRECHFRHMSKGVKKREGELSVGFVFRCCKSRQLLNRETGQYIIDKSSERSEKEVEFDSLLKGYFSNKHSLQEDHQFLLDLFLPMRDKYLSK